MRVCACREAHLIIIWIYHFLQVAVRYVRARG